MSDLAKRGWLDPCRGFALAFRGLGLLLSTRRLAALALAVAAVTVVSLAALAIGLWHAVPALVGWAWKVPASAWWRALHKVTEVAAFVLLFLAGANVLPMTLAAPLMDPISIETERLLGFEVQSGGFGRALREILRAWINAFWRLAVLAIGQLVFLIVLVIPAVGGPIGTGLNVLWTALWVCAAYLDVPMARHLYPFRSLVRVLRRRPALCAGFGAAIAMMLWVPLLNFFFVPAAVVGATLLYRGLVASGDLDEAPTSAVGSRGTEAGGGALEPPS